VTLVDRSVTLSGSRRREVESNASLAVHQQASRAANDYLIQYSDVLDRFQYVRFRTDLSPTALMTYGVPWSDIIPALHCRPCDVGRVLRSSCVHLMLMTLKYTASVRLHQLTSYRCACRPKIFGPVPRCVWMG